MVEVVRKNSQPTTQGTPVKEIKDSETRELMETLFHGSAMDFLNRFFPGKRRPNTILGSFSAVR